MNSSEPGTCGNCLFQFKSAKSMYKHKCLIKPTNDEPDLYVREEAELQLLMERENIHFVAKKPRKFFKFCEKTKTAVPGLYPLFFQQRGHVNPVLKLMGNDDSAYELLTKAATEGSFHLRKTVRIKLHDRVLQVNPVLLLPTNSKKLVGYSLIHSSEHLLVSRKRRKCQVKRELLQYIGM